MAGVAGEICANDAAGVIDAEMVPDAEDVADAEAEGEPEADNVEGEPMQRPQDRSQKPLSGPSQNVSHSPSHAALSAHVQCTLQSGRKSRHGEPAVAFADQVVTANEARRTIIWHCIISSVLVHRTQKLTASQAAGVPWLAWTDRPNSRSDQG